MEATEEYNIICAASILFKEVVTARLRAIWNRPPLDEMEGIGKHSLIWRIFMTSSMHAAIFHGKDDSENLQSARNTDKEPTVQNLIDVTQKLIREQNLEISGVSELSW